MGFELRELSGVLFKNERKTADKQPDYKGEVKINGVVMSISGWKKLTSKGGTFLSLSISEKRHVKAEDYRGGMPPERDPWDN